MRAISALTALSLMGCAIAPAPPPDGSAFGYFPEPAQTQWLDDGRRMVLLRDFAFVEPDGTRWSASGRTCPTPVSDDDLTIDWASIPPVFWSCGGRALRGSLSQRAHCPRCRVHASLQAPVAGRAQDVLSGGACGRHVRRRREADLRRRLALRSSLGLRRRAAGGAVAATDGRRRAADRLHPRQSRDIDGRYRGAVQPDALGRRLGSGPATIPPGTAPATTLSGLVSQVEPAN